MSKDVIYRYKKWRRNFDVFGVDVKFYYKNPYIYEISVVAPGLLFVIVVKPENDTFKIISDEEYMKALDNIRDILDARIEKTRRDFEDENN